MTVPVIKTALPGPRAKAIIERDRAVVSHSYTRGYPLVIERGVGAMVEDVPEGASSTGGPLERLAKRLEGSGDAGVWVRVLRLEHPSP